MGAKRVAFAMEADTAGQYHYVYIITIDI
jgi:hypothetical protein